MSCVILFIQVQIQWQNHGIGLPVVGDDCFVPGNPPRPEPIQDLTNTSDIIHYERLNVDTNVPRREITVKFAVSWTPPHVPYGNLSHYNIWLGSEILNDPNGDRQLNKIPVGIIEVIFLLNKNNSTFDCIISIINTYFNNFILHAC